MSPETPPVPVHPPGAPAGGASPLDLFCRPFTASPNMDQWLALMEVAAALHQRKAWTR
jgi:hypothetical protein